MRSKKAIINYLTETIPEILIMFLGFFRIKFFLQYLGEDVLGLYQMYGQFFAYINLTEAGFTTAALYSLYKPINDKDTKKTSSILSGINRIFKIIGLSMIAVGIILSFFIKCLIKDNAFDTTYIIISFIIFLLINVMGYFFKPYSIYFDAKEQKYIPNLIYQIGLLIKTLTEIVLLVLRFDLITILVVSLIIIIITNITVKIMLKKKHPEIALNVDKDYSSWKGTKHLIVHKIGGIVANNVDLLLISKTLGLGKVVIYSSYMYIINAIKTIISKLSSSLYSLIGIKMLDDNKDNNYKVFMELNNLMSYISIVICGSLAYAISPFINIFYEGEIITNNVLCFCFILTLFLNINSSILSIYANSTGLFKETKKCTIIEAIINLSLSIVGMMLFEIPGIILATSISYIVADYFIKPKILYSKIFNGKKSSDFYKNIFITILVFIISYLLNSSINIDTNNLFTWFIYGLTIFIINAIVVYIIFKLLKMNKWINRIKEILRRKK